MQYSKHLQQNASRVHLLSPSPELILLFLLNAFSPPTYLLQQKDYIYSAQVY